MPGVDITPSGSLGMLLSYGVGCAISARDQQKDYKTYVFLGDGEEQEGNVSEAARHAAHLDLTNLIAVLDCNGKQLSDPTSVCDFSDVGAVWQGYGWDVVCLEEGNDISSVCLAFERIAEVGRVGERPLLLIADTSKGFGLSGAVEHFSGYHTIGVCPGDVVDEGIATLRQKLTAMPKIDLPASGADLGRHPEKTESFVPAELCLAPLASTPNNPDFCQGDYFLGLKKAVLGGVFNSHPLYFLTADVTRRDQVEGLGLETFLRYYNVGIREQHMIGMAHGISVTNPSARIIINSFDAFLFRCLDQINAAVARAGAV